MRYFSRKSFVSSYRGSVGRIRVEPDSVRLSEIIARYMSRIPALGPAPAMGGGSQRRAWAQCRDGTYHLKLPEAETPRVLFDELLGVALGAMADLHPAPGALVDVTDVKLMDNTNKPVERGTYFGSLWLADYVELPDNITARADSVYTEWLYNLLAFDLLIMNGDRKHRDVLSRRGTVDFRGELIIVDHGNALTGANWTPEHIEQNHCALLDSVDGGLYHRLTDTGAAEKAARKIASSIAPELPDVLELLFRVQAEAEPVRSFCLRERQAIADILNVRAANLEELALLQMRKNTSSSAL